MPKISIIVPIYKAEKYLHRCIDSILAQTFTDWELLLVDDGSPDRSGAICDEYASKDARIRVFHKENGGVSVARNLGLDNAKGDFITFIDADDWITSNTLELCTSYISKYDIVRFSMVYVESMTEENKHKLILPNSDSKKEIMQRILSRNSLLGVSGGLYKKELFENPFIRFNPKLIMAEDWLVLCQLVNRSHCVIDLPDTCYCYNIMNEDSCSNNPSPFKVEQCLYAQKIITQKIDNTSLNLSSLDAGSVVLYKAMINSLYKENKAKNFIKELRRIKNEYSYPSLRSICMAQVSPFAKIALLIGWII